MRAPYRLKRKQREDALDEEEAQPAVAPTPPAEWPKAPQAILDGAALELVSFSWGGGSPSGSGGGPGKAHVTEMSISTRSGDQSARLGVGSASGQHFKTVVIVMPRDGGGYTITLKDGLIGSFSSHGDMDTWTANFAEYEFGTSPPPAS